MFFLLIALLIFAYLVYVHLDMSEKPEDGGQTSSSSIPGTSSTGRDISSSNDAPKKSTATAALPKYHTILPTVPEKSGDVELGSVRSRISRTVESLEWVNAITRACWPHIGKIIERELVPTIAPLIDAALPKPLKNFNFTRAHLGRDPLTVGKVTVHKRYGDSIALDLDVSFKGYPDIVMKVAPLSAPFGIKELRWDGRLTILLRPLTPILPCIGAVQATFVSHPELSMDFTGAANIADFRPIERVVNRVLRDVIASMLVLPNRMLFKLTDEVDFFDVYYPPMGVLNITVKRGVGFEKEKKAGIIKLTPDVYVKLEFGDGQFQTPVVKKSLSPEWNASHLFLLSDLEQSVKLKVWDWDPAVDDLLGQVLITADNLIKDSNLWTALDRKVNREVAGNAKILLNTQLLVFSSTRLVGPAVVSILIDRADHLPGTTNSAICQATVGSVVKRTFAVVKPPEPVPGVDPVNPIWNVSYDIIVPDVIGADVVLSVIADKRSVGSVTFSAAEIVALPSKFKAGNFRLGGDVTIRAKVIYRGLIPEGLNVK